MSRQCWQLKLICFLGIFGAIASDFDCAKAQIEPDDSLGSERSVVTPLDPDLPADEIDGGAIRGANLFHSFREFNVTQGRAAYFFSPNPEIQNILARVTGSNRSEILGTIGTFGNSNPNLFLINPNGILFGSRASLDGVKVAKLQRSATRQLEANV
jgi:filamentous hemagglutinin family protein